MINLGANIDKETGHGTPLEVILLYGDPSKLRGFFEFLKSEQYPYQPNHLAAAINNRFYLMTALLLESGADNFEDILVHFNASGTR